MNITLLLNQAADLVLKIGDLRWEAAIQGNQTEHQRLDALWWKAVKRLERRERYVTAGRGVTER